MLKIHKNVTMRGLTPLTDPADLGLTPSLTPSLDGRKCPFEPLVDCLGVLLIRPLKRALCREAKLIKKTTYGCLAEFASATLARLERIPSAAPIESQPVVNCRPADAESLGNDLGTFTILYRSDFTRFQLGELCVCQLPAISLSNFLQAA